jgi:SAM-dependent methyltransferase
MKVDRLIDAGNYRRGELFLKAAVASVPPNGDILDYGCGPGRISALLARCGFRVRGIDPSTAMIAAARQQSLDGVHVEFQSCQVSAAFPSGSYDAIVCSSVIEYVPDPDRFLQQFHAALRPQGILIISFANRRSFSRTMFQRRNLHLQDQKHLWVWEEFRDLLSRNGFQSAPKPQYFESVCDRLGPLSSLSASAHVGALGLVVARKQ